MRGILCTLVAALSSLQLAVAKPIPKATVAAVSYSTVTKAITSEIDTPYDLTFSTRIKYSTTLTISGYKFTVTDIPIQERTTGISTRYTTKKVASTITVTPGQATSTAAPTVKTTATTGKSATATCAAVQGWASNDYFDGSVQLGETQVTSADDCYLHCKATTGCVAFEHQPANTDSDNCWFYAKPFAKYVTQDITGLFFYDATCYGYTGSSTVGSSQTPVATTTSSAVTATSTCGVTGVVSADYIRDCVQAKYECDAFQCSYLASQYSAHAWSSNGNNCTLWNTPYESYFTASSQSTEAFSDSSCPIDYAAPATNHTFPSNAKCAAQGHTSNSSQSSWKVTYFLAQSVDNVDQCGALCTANKDCVIMQFNRANLGEYYGPENCRLFSSLPGDGDVAYYSQGTQWYYDRACYA